jgi:hypothetical protein
MSTCAAVLALAFALAPAQATPSPSVEDPRAITDAARDPKIVGARKIRPAEPATPSPTPRASASAHAPASAPASASAPAPASPSPSASPSTPRADVEPAPTDARCLPARGKCRRATIPGIALATVGTAALGAGIAMRLVPDYPDADSAVHDRSLHPPGVVLIAVGATVLVTGVAAIVTGQVLHRRARRAAAMRAIPGGFAF